jgi:sucrose-6-phosphate hydrolase SacC (GH32 family)
VMVYMGFPRGRGPSSVGMAISRDLIVWDRLGIALAPDDIPREHLGLHTVEIAYRDADLHLFVEVLTETDSLIRHSVIPIASING